VPHITAIIPAAGKGTRMKASINKQFMLLNGKPVLAHTLDLFEKCHYVSDVIVICAPGEEEDCSRLVHQYEYIKVKKIVTGGQERQHSIARGLVQLSEECDLVAVHDGARPLLLPEELINVINGAFGHDGAVLAVPVKDTIKKVSEELIVVSTPDRSKLWVVQTPQVFKKKVIIDAYNQAFREGFIGTDDAVLAERCGYVLKIVKGSYGNIKITTPEDLEFAGFLLERGNNKSEGRYRI
jgi:2-C-methyl-D-erythritol 4-phosphate cytidylyltransferase